MLSFAYVITGSTNIYIIINKMMSVESHFYFSIKKSHFKLKALPVKSVSTNRDWWSVRLDTTVIYTTVRIRVDLVLKQEKLRFY